jgi:hypothetical protein
MVTGSLCTIEKRQQIGADEVVNTITPAIRDADSDRNMIKIKAAEVDEALGKIVRGLKKYYWIQDNFLNRNTSTDAEFQKIFCGFYRVRRNKKWRTCYFDLMETAKENDMTFEQVLRKLKDRTGRVEASFANPAYAKELRKSIFPFGGS